MYNMIAFFMSKYSDFQVICDIISFITRLKDDLKDWLQGDLKVHAIKHL